MLANVKWRELTALRGGGISKATTLLAQARDAGLTAADAETWEDAVSALQFVARIPLSDIDVETPDEGEYSRLSHQRDQLLEQQRRLRDEISSARAFERDEQGYSKEATEQKARLTQIGIFEDSLPGHSCPLCSQDLPNTEDVPGIGQIKDALADVSTRLDSVTRAAPQIEQAIADINSRLQQVNVSLARNRAEMQAVQSANAHLQQVHDDVAKRAHILGRIGLYLESLPELPDTQNLERQAQELRGAVCDPRRRTQR